MDSPSVFVLRFEDRAALQRAFELIFDDDVVESCTVEPEELGIRFLAERDAGPAILERVQDAGGLAWCSRYDVRSGPKSP